MAGSTIGVVQVVLSARDDSLAKEMRAAGRQVKEFQSMVSSAFAAIGTATAGLIAVDGLKRMAAFVSAGIDLADAMERQARNLGIATSAMGTYQVLAARADLDVSTLTTAMGKMQETIVGAADGNKVAAATFAGLGLSIYHLQSLDADGQFRAIAGAIAAVPDPARRAALSVDVFGKAGKQMAGMLAQGTAAIEDATAAAEHLGLTLTDETQARIGAADGAIKAMNLSIDGIKMAVADAAAPSLAAFANLLTNAATRNGELRGSIRQTEYGLENLAAIILQVAQGVAGVVRVVMVPVQAIAVGVSALIDILREAWKTIEMFNTGTYDTSTSFRITSNVAASFGSNLESLKSLMSDSWADNFRGELAKVRQEIDRAQAAAAAASGATAGIAFDPVQFRARLDQANAAYWEQFDKNSAERERREAAKDRADREKATAEADERHAAWLQEMRDREMALRVDPKARGEFVGGATNDPRVTYEKEVADLIAAGKSMAEARAQADASQARAQAVASPDADVRVLYETEVQRLILEEQKRAGAALMRAQLDRQMAYGTAMANFFGDIQTITAEGAEHSRGAFLANRAAAMAQAEISAWLAYANILGQSTMYGGPLALPFAQAMATTALVAGHFAVANIAAQTIDGARANGGPVSRGGLYQVNERGPELLSIGDKSFLMMGDQGGQVTSNSALRAAPSVAVHVHNAPGTKTTVQQSGPPESPRIDVMIEQIDQAIASGIRSGTSATARAVQKTYGVNRARGAT